MCLTTFLIITSTNCIKQKTTINSGNSLWQEILFGISQGSTLGNLTIEYILMNFFLIMDDISLANYASDNILFMKTVINRRLSIKEIAVVFYLTFVK